MKILIVEDEKQALAESISSKSYREEGYKCEVASSYLQGDEKASMQNYDCILLDITLPGGNGIDILKQVKKNKSTSSVIIISAKNSLDDKVTGLVPWVPMTI